MKLYNARPKYAHRFYGFNGEAQYLHGHTGILAIEVEEDSVNMGVNMVFPCNEKNTSLAQKKTAAPNADIKPKFSAFKLPVQISPGEPACNRVRLGFALLLPRFRCSFENIISAIGYSLAAYCSQYLPATTNCRRKPCRMCGLHQAILERCQILE